MKPYIVALAVGLLVGVIYGLLNVRSPAPPIVALVGLLGILVGEQLVPLANRLIMRQPVTLAVLQDHAAEHVFGQLPERRQPPAQPTDPAAPDTVDG